jgi:outer membrane protein assembly factor BamB
MMVSLRLYFARLKDIPAKEIQPIDEWAIKTQARKYVTWAASALLVIGVGGVVLTKPYLTSPKEPVEAAEQLSTLSEQSNSLSEQNVTLSEQDNTASETVAEDTSATQEIIAENTPSEAAALPAPTTTSNAFRGNNSNGVSTAKNVPVKWDLAAGTNIAWKKPIPRSGYNTPVINGNKIFFSAADEEARELYCYDLNTGNQLWSVKADNIPGSPSAMPKVQEDTGLAASSVATNGQQVCAIFATGDIICADMDGKRLWAKNLGLPDNHYGYSSSLVTYGNTVIVQYDNQNTPRVMALDLATGTERWSKARTDKVVWSSPMIAQVGNSQELILMGTPNITAYNPQTGAQLWAVNCLTGEVGSSACSANGIIFGASEYSKLIAINGADGTQLWESTDYLPEVSSPVATKDNVYLATSYGVAASFNAQTGELRKEHELNDPFYSSPVIVGGKVFLFNTHGKLYIFSADDNFTLLDSFETGEPTFATPAFTDGRVIVRTNNSIYCAIAK